MKTTIALCFLLAACGDDAQPTSAPAPTPETSSYLPPVATVPVARADVQTMLTDGAVLAATQPREEPNGVRLMRIDATDVLGRLGLRSGDLVTSFDGEIVTTLAGLRAVMAHSASSVATRPEMLVFVEREGTALPVRWVIH